MTLSQIQKDKLFEIWTDYSINHIDFYKKNNIRSDEDLDKERVAVIPKVQKWMDDFINNDIPLEEFKTGVDGINKRHSLWGFKAINGQMFFNMLTKQSVITDRLSELSIILKDLFIKPIDIKAGKTKIQNLENFVREISRDVNDLRTAPKVGSIPFFLSYFWQIQDPINFPVYYTTMLRELKRSGIWHPEGNVAVDYSSFFILNHDSIIYLSELIGRSVSLWDFEHSLWYTNKISEIPITIQSPEIKPIIDIDKKPPVIVDALSSSYIPPIISNLPEIAKNSSSMNQICKNLNINIEKLFEERIAVLFSILGYETQLLGQGKGRVPDGIATCEEYRYAIIFDAKVRENPYTMGIDERAIREYIQTQSIKLRNKGIRNIYFMIISSAFSGDHDDAIRGIKIDTHVNEIILAEVNALLVMVEGKLSNPNVNLGPEGIQRLLAFSGILSESIVRSFLDS